VKQGGGEAILLRASQLVFAGLPFPDAVRGLGKIAVLVGLAGCGPWLTPIPTYWDPPPYAPRPPVVLDDRPVAVADVEPATPEPAAPVSDVAAPVDDRPACTAIYVVTARKRLYAFEPRSKTFELRGTLTCPGVTWTTPFSMAVAQTGSAHVLYNDGKMFAVDVVDATCTETPFVPHQPPGFSLFGMGYARHDDGESLFVAQIPMAGRSRGLARVDMKAGELHFIDRFSANPGNNIELTSTRDGLWGYFLNSPGTGGTLVEIDPDSAEIESMTPLAVGTRSSALAVAWWGGDFYIFTTFSRGSEVTRYDPEAGDMAVVATLEDTIVGAGVATCAPNG
jgi:hypothetical protein